MMSTKNTTILISGASIAGPTLAYWLKRYGFTPTVIERAPQLRAGGYPVDVRFEAVQVAKLMGIWPRLQQEKTTLGRDLVCQRAQSAHQPSQHASCAQVLRGLRRGCGGDHAGRSRQDALRAHQGRGGILLRGLHPSASSRTRQEST